MSQIDRIKISDAIRQLLIGIGDDPNRAGIIDTPGRVAKFWQEQMTPKEFTFTTFDSEGMDEMIVQSGIPFYSLCEHHLVPFFGTGAIAYIPNGKIVGLSKLARCLQYHAAGIQNQERITERVADHIAAILNPRGIAVLLRARHLCMEMRGVRMHDTYTTTCSIRGLFLDNPAAKAEFLIHAKGDHQ